MHTLPDIPFCVYDISASSPIPYAAISFSNQAGAIAFIREVVSPIHKLRSLTRNPDEYNIHRARCFEYGIVVTKIYANSKGMILAIGTSSGCRLPGTR